MTASRDIADIAELCGDAGVVIEPPASSADAATSSDGASSAADAEDADVGPRWRPLVLVPIPGLDAILGTVKPPLEVIKALLQVIAAFASTLAAILIGLLDPYRALVMAAYQLLRDLIQDITNSGAYLYYDAPGITSPLPTPAELGAPVELAKDFRAGKTAAPPPPAAPNGYAAWATRFAQSFDDPGDRERPTLSNGASVMAVFIVAAAPSAAALRQLMYLLGRLFNIASFIFAWEKFLQDSPDPDRSRAQLDPVAPDWKAARLKDLIPPIEQLEAIPEALRSLLLAGDNAAALLNELAAAINDKAKTLSDMADAIQQLIDLLDALRAAGLQVLPVMTTEGVEGLKRAFLSAENRPDGAYLAGICLLASGPSMAQATVLWNLLGQGGAFEQLALAAKETRDRAQQAAEAAGLEEKWENLETTAERAAEEVVESLANAPVELAEDLGRTAEELVEHATRPGELVDLAREQLDAVTTEAGRVFVTEAVAKGEAAVREARKRGPRALVAREVARSGEPPEKKTP